MKVVLIEDEVLSAEHLENLLKRILPEVEILAVFDSIKSSVNGLKLLPEIDLIFLDIHLADGLSFDIFKEFRSDTPVIFTTAFNEFAIKAFELNSLDYLLKPIGKSELLQAIEKFKRLNRSQNIQLDQILPFLKQKEQHYKTRFLVKLGENIRSITTENIQHFIFEDGLVLLIDDKGKRFPVDHSLENLEQILHPNFFFRINRKVIVHINSIEKISTFLNNRLSISAKNLSSENCIVSRERVSEFKKWLDQ